MTEKAPTIVRIFLVLVESFRRWPAVLRWSGTRRCGRGRRKANATGPTARFTQVSRPISPVIAHDFEDGLFPWERAEIVASFPPSGRILLGAAGGGRELFDLCRMGYEVLAFPNPCHGAPLQRRARWQRLSPGAMCAPSYADVVLAAELGQARWPASLRPEFTESFWAGPASPFGRTSAKLLKALRTLAPGAPVCSSVTLGTW